MQNMTIYTADCRGNPKNTSYPFKTEITCAADLERAVKYDHVCATYGDAHELKNGAEWLIRCKRGNDTFIKANCLPMDLDNDHSENPNEWKTLEDVKATFPGVMLYAVTSRNHMKVKQVKGKLLPARPKYHLYFPIDEITDMMQYTAMKQDIQQRFPWFDDNAMDAGRFLFGVDGATVTAVDGDNE